MNIEQERAAFEAWASGYDVQMFIDRSRHDKSLYAHAETNDAWAAWQICACRRGTAKKWLHSLYEPQKMELFS